MNELTHFTASGDAHMVDVGDKAITRRVAVACGSIEMQAATLRSIATGDSRKGDVLGVARLAGIMAAKRTSELIPLCHQVALTSITIEFELTSDLPGVRCEAQATTDAKTGVEMEALTAVQVALLTIYDMCKAIDRGMCIRDVQLVSKSGGRSGVWERPSDQPSR